MTDLVSLGTVFADFTQDDNAGNKIMLVQNIGGATANLAVACSRLGMKSAFIGKTGDDAFGKFAKSALENEKVDVSNLISDEKHQTPLAFIDHKKRGNEKYTFYRHDSADMYLKANEINKKLIDDCKVFHFGSLTMVKDPAYSATVKAVKYARSKNKIITYDPNYRKALWESDEPAMEKMTELISYCDIIKFSQDEFSIMTDSDNLIRGVANLLKMGVKIILISQGANGCIIAHRKGISQIPTHKVDIVDTTGSGDAFLACFIYKILSCGKAIEDYSFEEVCSFARFANAGATLCAMELGAVTAMADVETIEKFMDENTI